MEWQHVTDRAALSLCGMRYMGGLFWVVSVFVELESAGVAAGDGLIAKYLGLIRESRAGFRKP
jgi:hypothetical protein